MKHATYCGPAKYLRGETALIQPHVDGFVLAQFDDLIKFGPPSNEYEAQLRDEISQREDDDTVYLALGWHEFRESDFQVGEE